jgi:hypothetical protein
MLILSAGHIPLQQDSLVEALRQFTNYVGENLLAGPGADASITLNGSGARATALLASSLPADTVEFGLGFISSGDALTAAQFRESLSAQKPSGLAHKCGSMAPPWIGN